MTKMLQTLLFVEVLDEHEFAQEFELEGYFYPGQPHYLESYCPDEVEVLHAVNTKTLEILSYDEFLDRFKQDEYDLEDKILENMHANEMDDDIFDDDLEFLV